MIPVKQPVLFGYLDWYGFKPVLHQDTLYISKGIIGRSDNPLKLHTARDKQGKKKLVPSGGWTMPKTTLSLSDTAQNIDVVVHLDTDSLYYVVRSNDNTEIYPETYEHLLSFMWKDSGDWYYATPERDETYKKDARFGEYHHLRRRRIND